MVRYLETCGVGPSVLKAQSYRASLSLLFSGLARLGQSLRAWCLGLSCGLPRDSGALIAPPARQGPLFPQVEAIPVSYYWALHHAQLAGWQLPLLEYLM